MLIIDDLWQELTSDLLERWKTLLLATQRYVCFEADQTYLFIASKCSANFCIFLRHNFTRISIFIHFRSAVYIRYPLISSGHSFDSTWSNTYLKYILIGQSADYEFNLIECRNRQLIFAQLDRVYWQAILLLQAHEKCYQPQYTAYMVTFIDIMLREIRPLPFDDFSAWLTAKE